MGWPQGLWMASYSVMLGLTMVGCGLDGVRGQLIRIEGDHYLLREPSGHVRKLHVDGHTHKDAVQPGDDIQVYITKEGYAEFIQRLEK
jgi:hypothetical protein